jgi:hypothetical protein
MKNALKFPFYFDVMMWLKGTVAAGKHMEIQKNWLGNCEGKWENVGLLLLNPDQAPASQGGGKGP